MPTILIAGLGLIGGSAGMALRARGWYVRYVDPHVSLEEARRAGAADERVEHFGDADLTLLAAPLDVAIGHLRETQTLVTSACGLMQPLRELGHARFVAGHPMAGSEQSGLAAARADLFEGKRWFVDDDDALVEQMIADCGARSERVDAREHDDAMALVSQLPQLLSTALAAYLDDRDVARFAGSGLATFLRLASSDATVWAPLLAANRETLAPHADALATIVRELIDGDPRELFAKAQRFRRTL
ncbi:MAG TPA: prephenate dehydrogenase/arogenate dehydrogenase family protein [Thermoanaerobaculia bacterium]